MSDGELNRDLAQYHLLQQGEQVDRATGQQHGADQPGPPITLTADQDLVDEDAEQDRQRQTGSCEQEAGQGDVGERASGLTQPGPERAPDVGRFAARLEGRGGLGRDDNAGERLAEHFAADGAPAVGGIVEVVAVPGNAFKYEEVAELPEENGGELQVAERLDVFAPASQPETVAGAGADDVGGVGAVSADAAGITQLLERHPPSEMGEDDAK